MAGVVCHGRGVVPCKPRDVREDDNKLIGAFANRSRLEAAAVHGLVVLR